MKNDIKNEILEVKDSITRDFKEQTEKMCKLINQIKDENEVLRNRSMWSTLIFWGVPENEQSDTWDTISWHRVSLLSSRLLNLNYDELDLQPSRAQRTPKTTDDNNTTPIFAVFVNWHYADDIRTKVILLHAESKSKITVSQIISKEMTQKWSSYEKKRNTSWVTWTQDLPGIPSTSDGKDEKQLQQV